MYIYIKHLKHVTYMVSILRHASWEAAKGVIAAGCTSALAVLDNEAGVESNSGGSMRDKACNQDVRN